MSKTNTFTAEGVLDETNIILFGVSCSSFIAPPPAVPANGDVRVTIRDSDTADDSGTILCRFVITVQGGLQSVTFPAGVRITEGVAVNIDNSSDPHSDILVVLDYA